MTTFPPVSSLLPHHEPMVLLDALQEVGTQHLVCSATVRVGGAFVLGSALPVLATLEHMAQAVAAWAGWCGRQAGEPVRIGYLLGCRELSLSRDSVPVGTQLTIRAERVWGDNALGSFACEVHAGAELLAKATLSVAQPTEADGEIP